MKMYCVKLKRYTENVPNSERAVKTKNGRYMLKAKCAETGVTKTRFIKASDAQKLQSGKGLLLGKNSPFKRIPLIGAIL